MAATGTLASSISSLSSNSSQPPSVSRTYKQASQLFLTRQLAEAWNSLVILVTAANPSHENRTEDSYDHQPRQSQAPIASAGKSARVKVWSLWIAILHELMQLGAEDGGKVMENVEAQDGRNGSKQWSALAKKVRDGEIWNDVVSSGYSGFEVAVDGEVVADLATLLLSHAPSQKLTQARLESYISASSSIAWPEQLTSQLEQAQRGLTTPQPLARMDRGATNGHGTGDAQNGTSTPRDLGTQLRLLELYVLHVLPRNEEWDYARDVVSMSEVLDDEKKEAFLAALGGLREEHELHERREVELERQRVKEINETGLDEHGEARSSIDLRNCRTRRDAPSRIVGAANTDIASKPSPATVHGSIPSQPLKAQQSAALSKSSIRKSNSSGVPSKRTPSNVSSALLRRASLTLLSLQKTFLQISRGLSRNPLILFRVVVLVVAMVVALGRGDVRDRVREGWVKVKKTILLGKVSYL